MTQTSIMRSSLENSPMTLVSSWKNFTKNFTANFQMVHPDRGESRIGNICNFQPISCSTSETVQAHRTIATIGSPMRAFDCYQNHWPWMTLNNRYAFDCRKDASFGSQYKNFNRPILSGVWWATNSSGTAEIITECMASFLRYFEF